MALWKFVERKLAALNRRESYLVDQCGIPQNTVDRIRAGGVIRDGAKQKLALALGCTIGDINEAISQQDPVEIKVHDMELLARENGESLLTAKAKPVPLPDYPETDEKPVPMPTYPAERAEAITLPEYLLNGRTAVDDYKQKLKNICLQKMVEFRLSGNVAKDLYSEIGKALMEELVKEE